MFPHSSQSFSSSRSPLIPWLVAGFLALALAPATAGAMPGREHQAQPVQQDQRAPDQVSPVSGNAIGGPKLDLRAPDQTTPATVYGSHGPLPTSGPLPMSHSMPSPAVSSPSSGDGTDTWLIAGIGGALLAACAAGIGIARKTRVRAVRHA
jgi:hypothetical protein